MDYLRELTSPYRVPDLSRLWRNVEGDDERDGGDNGPSLVVQLESYLVRFQELALWTEPKHSAIALLVVHLAYFYLSCTSSSALNLACWAVLVGFVYTTWINRIWPEIRVPLPEDERPDSEAFTPMHPDCLSAPELERNLAVIRERAAIAVEAVREMRSDSPGKFFGVTSALLVVLAYVGSYMTALGLLYFVVVGALALPGLAKVLLQHPAVQCFAETVFKQDTDETDSVKEESEKIEEKKVEVAEEETTMSAKYLASLQYSLAETLNQGSAYLSSVVPAASAATASSSAPTPAAFASGVVQQCQHREDEEDMKEYLPTSSAESDKILEAEAEGEELAAARRKRSRNSSNGNEVRWRANCVRYTVLRYTK
jgi:hypothetical protein